MSTNITDNVNDAANDVNINYPYQPGTGLDPTVGPSDLPLDLDLRVKIATFEAIERNIANYPHREVATSSDGFIRTYYMGGNDTMVLTAEYKDENTIVKTLTGKTGYDGTMVKTVKYAGSIETKLIKDTVYAFA